VGDPGAREEGPRGRSRDGRKRREREAWVQCETCSKWRRVRQSVAEAFARADAGQWTCAISEHPRVNECDVPQELPDDDIDERVALGDKCPFYDDDDLDPPEVIREEEEEEGDVRDDSDDRRRTTRTTRTTRTICSRTRLPAAGPTPPRFAPRDEDTGARGGSPRRDASRRGDETERRARTRTSRERLGSSGGLGGPGFGVGGTARESRGGGRGRPRQPRRGARVLRAPG
jgi:hypothetical protein